MNKLIRFANFAGVFVLVAMGIPSLAKADHREFQARLSGEQQVTEEVTTGRGTADVRFNPAYRYVNVDVTINDLVGTFSAAHFHCARPGENGPVVFGLVMPGPLALDGNRIRGRLTNADYTGADCVSVVGRTINNIASLALAMRDGLIYLNVHTSSAAGGEVRGQMVAKHDDNSAASTGN